jgi:hypothetical protein
VKPWQLLVNYLFFYDFGINQGASEDEKHMLNKDVEPTKVRADPLTGYIPCIYVNGDFRDSYNLLQLSVQILRNYGLLPIL